MMKDPYGFLFSGICFVFIDLFVLPDFLGYALFAYGIHLLPAFQNLKRWSINFAIILTVLSFLVELGEWQGVSLFEPVVEQFMQFLFIVLMYFIFQLLLHIHEKKLLEDKTFKTYQKFMALMLCGFVIQAFSINVEASLQENIYFLGSILQLMAFMLFFKYCRIGSKYFKETTDKS